MNMKKYTIALLFPLVIGLSACQQDKTDTTFSPKDVHFVDIFENNAQIEEIKTRFIAGLKNVNKIIYERSETNHYYDALGNSDKMSSVTKGSIEGFENGYVSDGASTKSYNNTVVEEITGKVQTYAENGSYYRVYSSNASIFDNYTIGEYSDSTKDYVNRMLLSGGFKTDISNCFSNDSYSVQYPTSYSILTIGKTNKGRIVAYMEYKNINILNVGNLDKEYTQITEGYSYLEGKEVGTNIEITKRQEGLKTTGNFAGNTYSSYVLLDDYKLLREYGSDTIYKYGDLKENNDLPKIKENLPKSFFSSMTLNVGSYQPTYSSSGTITGISNGESADYLPSAVDNSSRKASFYVIPLQSHRIYRFIITFTYFSLKEDATTHKLTYEFHDSQQIIAEPESPLLEYVAVSDNNFYWYKGETDSTLKINIELDQEYQSCFLTIA